MEEPQRAVRPLDTRRYREVASKLRGIAGQCRVPASRQKILDLASRYEDIANDFVTRSLPEDFPEEAANQLLSTGRY